mgnify:CR=1 FL=1
MVGTTFHMKNFEVPLHLMANDSGDDITRETIVEAHHIYNGLTDDEYRDEAPNIADTSAARFFAELDGPSWELRKEEINFAHHTELRPKCFEIPLAFASGGDIDRARWLVDDMIEQGILHEPISNHEAFFERADMKEEAFEQIAEAEAEQRREQVIQDLRQKDQ